MTRAFGVGDTLRAATLERRIVEAAASPASIATVRTSGAAVVHLAGQSCVARDISGLLTHVNSATVLVSGSAVSHADVSQIFCAGTVGTAVDVSLTGTDFVFGIHINDVRSRDGNSYGVRLRNAGSSTLQNTIVRGVTMGPNAAAIGVQVENSGSGTINQTHISGVAVRAISKGVAINKTAGNLDRVAVSDSSLNAATTPVEQTGSPTNVVIGGNVFV